MCEYFFKKDLHNMLNHYLTAFYIDSNRSFIYIPEKSCNDSPEINQIFCFQHEINLTINDFV